MEKFDVVQLNYDLLRKVKSYYVSNSFPTFIFYETSNILEPHQIFPNSVHLSLHWEACVLGIKNEYRMSSGWFKMNQVWKNLMWFNLNDIYLIIFSTFIYCIRSVPPINCATVEDMLWQVKVLHILSTNFQISLLYKY